MPDRVKESVARTFLMNGIQDWGQTDEARAKATAEYLIAAGFDVEPSGYPVFGGMFDQLPIDGKDGKAAFDWLKATLEKLQRGEFHSEVEQLTAALARTPERKGGEND